jgi:hypothetical protein
MPLCADIVLKEAYLLGSSHPSELLEQRADGLIETNHRID